jgi:hypothetical protein
VEEAETAAAFGVVQKHRQAVGHGYGKGNSRIPADNAVRREAGAFRFHHIPGMNLTGGQNPPGIKVQGAEQGRPAGVSSCAATGRRFGVEIHVPRGAGRYKAGNTL